MAPCPEEIAFAQATGFNTLQIRGPEEGLSERQLGEALEEVAEKLRAANLSATMEILIGVDAQGFTANGRTPLDVLRTNLPAIRALSCPHVHWHLVPRAKMSEANNHHLPLGLGNIDLSSYCHALLQGKFHGPAILEIGGQPKSGGFGRDTDAALVDSQQRLGRAIREAHRRCPTRPEGQA